jgi:hypothetical protein
MDCLLVRNLRYAIVFAVKTYLDFHTWLMLMFHRWFSWSWVHWFSEGLSVYKALSQRGENGHFKNITISIITGWESLPSNPCNSGCQHSQRQVLGIWFKNFGQHRVLTFVLSCFRWPPDYIKIEYLLRTCPVTCSNSNKWGFPL